MLVPFSYSFLINVLIVAKCNVNLQLLLLQSNFRYVLIVAKCNVNVLLFHYFSLLIYVLIVAKCNVNHDINTDIIPILDSINSSKV